MKLVCREPGTDEARRLLNSDEERVAPDWILAEVANGLANKVRYEALDCARASDALAALPTFIDRMIPSLPLLSRTLRLSIDVQHALYDCLYLCVAIDENARVITADDKLVKAARAARLHEHVEPLLWER